jgi:hypothetical protein
LGLIRLGEIEASLVDPEDFPFFSWMRIRKLLVPLVPLGKSFRGTVAMLVGIAVVGSALVWGLEHWAPLADALRHKSKHDDKLREIAEQFAPSEHRTANVEPPRNTDPTEPSDEKPAETLEPAEPPSPYSFDLIHPGVVRLAHPEFLLKPEVVQLLELTRKQRDQLRELFAHYKASSTELFKAGQDPLVNLGRRCWDILTEKQRESMAQLHEALQAAPAKPSAKPSPETNSARDAFGPTSG